MSVEFFDLFVGNDTKDNSELNCKVLERMEQMSLMFTTSIERLCNENHEMKERLINIETMAFKFTGEAESVKTNGKKRFRKAESSIDESDSSISED